MRRFKDSRGFNLIESAIVLGVVGLVVGGIWVAASAVSNHLKVSQTHQDLLKICQTATNLLTKNLTPAGTGYSDISTSAIEMGIFPENWVVNGQLRSPIGSAVTAYWWQADRWWNAAGVSIGSAVTLYLVDVPKNRCRQLLGYVRSSDNRLIKGIEVGVGTSGMGWTSVQTFALPYSGYLPNACNSVTQKISFTCQPK